MTDLPLPFPLDPEHREVRVSDAERQHVVDVLRRECGQGRLTLDEFSERAGHAYGARTRGQLAAVVADLPPLPAPSPLTVPAQNGAAVESRRRRAVRWVVSVMGGNQQKGRWRVGDEVVAVAIMGGCEIDLRQAEVDGPEVVITAFALMGGIDIVVPEGIEVVMDGFALMGGREMRVADVPALPGAPVVRVRAFPVMGGVSVRSKGPNSGRRGRRQQIEQRQRERAERHAHRRDRPRGGRYASLPETPASPPAPSMPPPTPGVEALAGTVADQWRELRSTVAPDGTVTILFSDIEGFTTTTERLGDVAAKRLLEEHHAIVRRCVEEHRGFEVKNVGDGFMLAFSGAGRALSCAIEIQRAFQARNARVGGEPLRVRMGLHTGEAIRDADDFLGTTVNLASRIASEAGGEEILVSSLLRDLCATSGQFEFDDGRELELRGITQPQRVHRVRWR